MNKFDDKKGIEMCNKRWEIYYRNRKANAYRADVKAKHERRESVMLFTSEMAVIAIMMIQILGVLR